MRLTATPPRCCALTDGPQPSPVQASQIAAHYPHSAPPRPSGACIRPGRPAARPKRPSASTGWAAFLRIALDCFSVSTIRRPRLLGRPDHPGVGRSLRRGRAVAIERGRRHPAPKGIMPSAEYLPRPLRRHHGRSGQCLPGRLARRGIDYAGPTRPWCVRPGGGLHPTPPPRDIAWARMLAF